MSDAPPPPHPGQPSPPHGEPEGALLFDPNAPDFGTGGGAPGGGPDGSRLPLVIGGIVALAAAVGVGFLLARSSGPDPTSDDPTAVLPPPVTAPHIALLPDSMLVGSVGDTLSFTLLVTTAAGAPIPDTLVRVALEEGEAVIIGAEGRTDSLGVVRSAVVLGEHPGRTLIAASLSGAPATGGRLEIESLAGVPAEIRVVSGNGQRAMMGELLPDRLFVEVTDDVGNPVPNAEVRFRVEMGDGVTAPTQTRTDSTGRASALWRLGRMVGAHRLSATATDGGGSVTFSATGQAQPSEGDENRPLEATSVTVRAERYVVGGSHVCRISGGSLTCRGGNERGQSGGSGVPGFVSLAAGSAHSCALDAAGIASCWGANERGQLGDGTRVDRAQPTRVRTELRFSTIVAGAAHTCGLAGGGVPFCWGLNLNGQLGDGSRNDQTTPRTVGSGITFVSLASGWNHTCGLTSNGNAFCWGLNNHGQLGDGATLDRLVPNLVLGSVESMVAGNTHTCGIAEHEVLCWGGNNNGQVGDGSNDDRSAPTPVAGLPGTPTALAAGAVHTCALVAGGSAYCWGQNLAGQLGDGTTESRNQAVAVTGGLTFSEIHAGGAQTCGITADGAEYCWGLNQSGQLGEGTRMSRSSPTRVTN